VSCTDTNPTEEADNEDVDHSDRRSRVGRGHFLRPGARHDGFALVEQQHAEISDDRIFTVLYKYVGKRRIELQICQHGRLRKGCEAAEPELFAKSEQEYDRLEAVKRWQERRNPAPILVRGFSAIADVVDLH
jgi:hypothetical protein